MNAAGQRSNRDTFNGDTQRLNVPHEVFGRNVRPDAPLLGFFKGRSGFTLIEIAVVLAIIGMILLLVLPRLPKSDSENLKISARTLASTLRYIQDRAATGRTTYFLKIEPGTGTVKVVEGAADGGEKEPADPLLQKRTVKDGIIVADVFIPRLGKIGDGQIKIECGAAGLRDFVSIHLRSADNSFWTVMAFPSSGKVKVYEGYQEEAL
jgi:general secretion pathway protein H